jgi:hypothetical protein
MPLTISLFRAECPLCGWRRIETSQEVLLKEMKRCGCIPRPGDIGWETMACGKCGHVGGHDADGGCVHAACPKCEAPIAITSTQVIVGVPR